MFTPPVSPVARNPIFPFASSPLAPRSVNVPPRFMSSTHGKGKSSTSRPPSPPYTPSTRPFQFRASTAPPDASHGTPAASRAARRLPESSPLSRSTDLRRNQRRDRFLGNVRNRQDDARWNARGDQILYSDFVQQRQRWEADKASSAPDEDEQPDDVESQFVLDERSADPSARHLVPQFDDQGMDDSPVTTSHDHLLEDHLAPHEHPVRRRGITLSHDDDAELEALLDAEASELDHLVKLHEQERLAHSSSPIYAEDDEFEQALQSLVMDGALDSMDIS